MSVRVLGPNVRHVRVVVEKFILDLPGYAPLPLVEGVGEEDVWDAARRGWGPDVRVRIFPTDFADEVAVGYVLVSGFYREVVATPEKAAALADAPAAQAMPSYYWDRMPAPDEVREILGADVVVGLRRSVIEYAQAQGLAWIGRVGCVGRLRPLFGKELL